AAAAPSARARSGRSGHRMPRPQSVNARPGEVVDRPAASALAGDLEREPEWDAVVGAAGARESLPVARLPEHLGRAAAIRGAGDGRDVREAAVEIMRRCRPRCEPFTVGVT